MASQRDAPVPVVADIEAAGRRAELRPAVGVGLLNNGLYHELVARGYAI